MKVWAPRTVRAKLTLITMSVIALLLFAIGFTSEVSARAATYQGIDRDLERRGEDFARMLSTRPNRFGPPGGNGGPPNDNGQPMGPPMNFDGNGPQGNGSPNPNGSGEQDRPRFQKRSDPMWVAPVAVDVPFSVANIGKAPMAEKPFDQVGYERAAKGERNWRTVYVDGEPRRVYSTPARKEGKVFKVVQVAYSMADTIATLDKLHTTLLQFAIPSGVLLGGLASFFLVSQLIKPLRRITQEADRIGEEGFEERLRPRGNDEFAALARTLNGMLERLSQTYRLEKETSRRLQQTVDQQRRFTSDASHELKTPLAVIKANTGLLLHSPGEPEDLKESLQAIDAAASRMNLLVRDLLVLARTDSGRSATKPRACDLGYIVKEAITGVPKSKDRVALINNAGGAVVVASPEDLGRVFINLIDNALKHSGTAKVKVQIDSQGTNFRVLVADQGCGIEPQHIPHLFDRFYRIDSSRTVDTGGSGLGLAICKGIVESHGGQITVESVVGKGTTFTVMLLAAQADSPSEV